MSKMIGNVIGKYIQGISKLNKDIEGGVFILNKVPSYYEELDKLRRVREEIWRDIDSGKKPDISEVDRVNKQLEKVEEIEGEIQPYIPGRIVISDKLRFTSNPGWVHVLNLLRLVPKAFISSYVPTDSERKSFESEVQTLYERCGIKSYFFVVNERTYGGLVERLQQEDEIIIDREFDNEGYIHKKGSWRDKIPDCRRGYIPKGVHTK